MWQDPPPIPDDYNLVTELRKKSRGGGVGFIINNDIEYDKIPSPFTPKKLETICIKTTLGKHSYIILNCYIGFTDKTTSIHRMNAFIHDLKQKYNGKNENIICMGDYNTNILENNRDSQELLNGMSSNNLEPVITYPTRIANTNARTNTNTVTLSCIDNIFMKTHMRLKSNIICSNISDHFAILTEIPRIEPKQKKNKKEYIEIRQYTKENIEKLREKLLAYNTDELQRMNVNESTETFTSWLNENIEKLCPLKRIKLTKNKPWYTKGFAKSRKTLNKLALKQAKNPTFQNIENFNTYRKKYKQLLKKAKYSHYQIQFEKHKTSTREQWMLVNELCERKTKHKLPDKIRVNGKLVHDKKELANHFNMTFAGMGEKIASRFPDNTEYKRNLSELQINDSADLVPINNTETEKYINQLIPKKSHGHDLCTNKLIKDLKTEIAPIITILINNSIRDKKYPKIWKISRVLPLYKTGKHTDPSNYRPISLGSTISKCLEKHVKRLLNDHLTEHNILPLNQFGFRKNTRTSHMLHKVINELTTRIESNQYIRMINIDFSKAFDCVSHPLLIRKLRIIGLSDNFIKWFQSYLSGRTQYTEYNGILSEKTNVLWGVPQGSVLGPLLYLIYTFDMKFITEKDCFNFADDTSLIISAPTEEECIRKSEETLNKFYKWSCNNKLAMNAINKTKYMAFNFTDTQPFELNGQIIEKVNSYKLLGVYIDDKLNWNTHTTNLCKKLRSSLYNLSRLKKSMNSNFKMLIMKGIFMSHLNYCIEIWSGTSKTNLKRLNIMQKKAIRKVYNKPPSSHTNNLFKAANIPTLDQLIKISSLNYTKSCRLDSSPKNVKLLYNTREPSRNLTRQDKTDIIQVPFTSRTYISNQIYIRTAKLWNECPNELKTQNQKKFKQLTKDIYMSFS